jgi:hypothetical protein
MGGGLEISLDSGAFKALAWSNQEGGFSGGSGILDPKIIILVYYITTHIWEQSNVPLNNSIDIVKLEIRFESLRVDSVTGGKIQ